MLPTTEMMIRTHDKRAWQVQRRMLRITQEITKLAVPLERIAQRVKAKRLTPAELLERARQASDHVFTPRPNGRLVCTLCRAFVAPGRLRTWLERYPKCNRAWEAVPPGAVAPVPLPPGAWIGRQLAHESHVLITYRGITWCSRCGAFGSETARKLLRPCQPPTAAGRSHLHALSQLRPPTTKFQWPLDELGRERQVQPHYEHTRTRTASAAQRAQRRAAQRGKLTKGGVSARAWKARRDTPKKKRRTTWASPHAGKAQSTTDAADETNDKEHGSGDQKRQRGSTPAASASDAARAQRQRRPTAAEATPRGQKGARRATEADGEPHAQRRRQQPPAREPAPRGRKRAATTPASPRRLGPPAPPTTTTTPAATPPATPTTTPEAALGPDAAAAETAPPSHLTAAERIAAMRARVRARHATLIAGDKP